MRRIELFKQPEQMPRKNQATKVVVGQESRIVFKRTDFTELKYKIKLTGLKRRFTAGYVPDACCFFGEVSLDEKKLRIQFCQDGP